MKKKKKKRERKKKKKKKERKEKRNNLPFLVELCCFPVQTKKDKLFCFSSVRMMACVLRLSPLEL